MIKEVTKTSCYHLELQRSPILQQETNREFFCERTSYSGPALGCLEKSERNIGCKRWLVEDHRLN